MRFVPSAGLGTCRLKPKDSDLERAMEVFKAHNIRYFFYTGGDNSQLACHRVSELAKSSDWDMRVIGIPKTIDNDLVVTDCCPDSAQRRATRRSAASSSARDAEAFGTLEVVEIMGRNEGWLTGATSAAPTRLPMPRRTCATCPRSRLPASSSSADVKAKLR